MSNHEKHIKLMNSNNLQTKPLDKATVNRSVLSYLPYDVMVKTNEGIIKLTPTILFSFYNSIGIDKINFILRPLSDFLKFDEKLGYCPVNAIGLNYNDFLNFSDDEISNKILKEIPYYLVTRLLEIHVDIYNLIPKGLAISIHDVQ